MDSQLLRYGMEPALIVDSEITIAEAVEKMKLAGQTCVLVRGAWGRIDGIFTDNDLMKKLNHVGPGGAQWTTPIYLVMSRDVEMLPLSLIHQAPELMATKNIRHVPILEERGTGFQHVLGLLTTDGIFRAGIEASRSWRDVQTVQKFRPQSVGVISADGSLYSGLAELFGTVGKYVVHSIRRGDLLLEDHIRMVGDSHEWIIFDVDDVPLRRLATVLRILNSNENVRRILLVCHPERHVGSGHDLLQALQKGPKFEVRSKPIDSNDLAECLLGEAFAPEQGVG